jgi:hypothetical protein
MIAEFDSFRGSDRDGWVGKSTHATPLRNEENWRNCNDPDNLQQEAQREFKGSIGDGYMN